KEIRRLEQLADFFHLAQTLQPDTSTTVSWMPLNDGFVCVVNIRENRVARLIRDELGRWRFSYGPVRMRLGNRKQEALSDATALLRSNLSDEDLRK
ncbi:hypothetical protein, partial [Clostridioides difficile]|uniref:hypothetical protein n=1 Tax=Clostridioides difficile TaxID=1496 RepID=UPI0018DC640F